MKSISFFNSICFAIALAASPCAAQSPRAEIIEFPASPASSTAEPAPQGPETAGLQTRVFRVPADFNRGKPPADPFAAPSAIPVRPSATEVLKSLGVEFPPGATATFSPASSRLVVRNTPEQLDALEFLVATLFGQDTSTEQGHVHLEIFSLPPLAARKALIALPDEAELFEWLNNELAKPDSAVKLEHHSITMVRSGQKSRSDSVNEIARPSEFQGPQIPQQSSLPVDPATTPAGSGGAVFPPWPRGASTPTGHSFRDTGHILEVELTLAKDSPIADLNLAPECCHRAGIVKLGVMGEIYQPVFETQRSSAQVSNWVDQPTLVSTFSPPVNTGVPGGNQIDRTWLLFVTVKKPG